MRNLMLSTAILAGLSGVAMAQDATSPMFRTVPDPMELRASQFIGMPVDSSETALTAEEYAGMQDNWNDIGAINDVILGRDGSVAAVLVDIGGFLGIGEKPVALKLSDIDILRNQGGDDVRVYVSMTKEQLEAMPKFGG